MGKTFWILEEYSEKVDQPGIKKDLLEGILSGRNVSSFLFHFI